MNAEETTAYLEHCRVQRGLSVHSLRAYAQDLNAFLKFRASQSPEASVTSETVLTYTLHLRETLALDASTVRRRLVTLRACFA